MLGPGIRGHVSTFVVVICQVMKRGKTEENRKLTTYILA